MVQVLHYIYREVDCVDTVTKFH